MSQAFISGFSLGFGLIMAIGAQNAYVLRHGLRRSHVLPLVAICAGSDALLIAAGVAGASVIFESAPWIGPLMRYAGAAFLVVYGMLALRRAMGPAEALDPDGQGAQRLWPVLATCLMLTWANPHVYLDTVLLLGSISAQFGADRWEFGAGAMLASLCFFMALGFGARLLAPFFARPAAWRALDVAVAVTMLVIALSLVLGG
ncbi:MAG: LysE/ArgO family amino acid transporter [Celeribacter sp.]|jgi:L-lysine exporter family protein LysE/ArgO